MKQKEKEALGPQSKKKPKGENDSGSDIEDYFENPNNRERFEEEKNNYSEVLVASGVDAVLNAIEGKIDKHPEKRIKAVSLLYLVNLELIFKKYSSLLGSIETMAICGIWVQELEAQMVEFFTQIGMGGLSRKIL
jgi:hypothetical protein